MSLYFEENTDLQGLAEALARLGYIVSLSDEAPSGNSSNLARLGTSGALAANLMMFSLPFYTGLQGDIWPRLFGWIGFLLCLPLLGWCGREFFSRAYAALRLGVPGLDLPIALGLAGGFVLSTWNLMRGMVHDLYFDSMGMLVFFLLLGRHVQRGLVRGALSEGNRLQGEMPQPVEVFRNESWTEVSPSELVQGDRMRLRNGDVLATDGTLLDEETVLDMNVVSGESKPIRGYRGQHLPAGSVNMGGRIEVEASATSLDSGFARLGALAQSLVEKSNNGDRAAIGFLVFVLGAAMLGGSWWWHIGGVNAGLSVALTVLIVACPCALALSEPTARAFALKLAFNRGILLKSADVFGRLLKVKHVVFDKTGVLTGGHPEIEKTCYFVDQHHWLDAAAAALETQTDHPLARAFGNLQGEGPHALIRHVERVRVEPGYGLSGLVDGHQLILASPRGLRRFGCETSVVEIMEAALAEADGRTPVCAVLDGKAAALYFIEDAPRPEAADLIANLQDRKLRTTLLSGDDLQVVNRMGRRLNIPHCLGEMLPEQKLAFIQAADRNHILMAGDGLNDMGALAAAGVGLTHDGASGSALKFSDIILRGPDLSRVSQVFDLARTAARARRRGMVVSLAYNILAVCLSLAGWISPLLAALLMPLSSLSMIGLVALSFRVERHSSSFCLVSIGSSRFSNLPQRNQGGQFIFKPAGSEEHKIFLQKQVAEQKARFEALLKADLLALNTTLVTRNLGGVIVPQIKDSIPQTAFRFR